MDTGPGDIRRAYSAGFTKGVSVALAVTACLCTLYAIAITVAYVPGFRNVFAQVNVAMPHVTMIVMTHYGKAGAVLGSSSLTCLAIAIKWGHRRESVISSIICFVLAATWLAIVREGLFLPLMNVTMGIGR